MKFLKKDEIKIKNGGYLMSGNDAVTHTEFVRAQEQAHYWVLIAEELKGKNFKERKADKLSDVFDAVERKFAASSVVSFVDTKAIPEMKLTTQLKSEALDFMKVVGDNDVINQVNTKMQDFKVLKNFEEFGLFFEPGIVKLTKIYTVEEVIAAITAYVTATK